jgi:hypothetical protein
MSPFASTAFMLIVPHVWAMPYSSYSRSLPPNDRQTDDAATTRAPARRARNAAASRTARASESPALRRVFPLDPLSAALGCQEVLFLEAHLEREALRILADQRMMWSV